MELLLTDHVRYFNTIECGSCRMEGLEAQSWVRNFLDEAVILFNNVVEVFHAQNLNFLVGL